MSRKKIIILSVTALAVIGGSAAIGASIVKAKRGQAKEKIEQGAQVRIPTATAGDSSLYQLSEASGSWAGEIVSPSILEVHPQSEGSIIQLYVRVGQKVSAGERVARLSPPPASLERASMAAEKKEALIRARANAEGTQMVVTKSREQFLEARKSLIPARDAAIAVAQKDIERNLFVDQSSELELEKTRKEKEAAVDLAEKELQKYTVDAASDERELRTLVEQIVERDLTLMTTWTGSSLKKLSGQWAFRFKLGMGALEPSSKHEYETAVSRIIRSLYSSSPIDDDAIAYAASAKKLVYASSVWGDELETESLNILRSETRENQMKTVAAIKEKKESENMVEVKKAELAKMIAERDKEVTSSSITVRSSRINSESNEIAKRKTQIDGELEYQNRKREIDIRLSELDRELVLAQKDVIAAEQSYATFLSDLSSQTISAQRSGIVSGIFKKTGDYVMPQDIVISISQENSDDSFVRFRVPSDSQRPEVGSEVTVIRPGFPFDRKKAIVTGVGGAVGSQGVFVAEAEFIEPVHWPVNALVRVMPSEKSEAIFVPFTALHTSDDSGESSIVVLKKDGPAEKRTVLTGKAVGDTVEIIEGLVRGEQYLSKQLPKEVLEKLLVEGTKGIQGMVIEAAEQKGEKSEVHEVHGE